ncbi:hypothetical protein T11_11547 [Trichinella zimbabwensis]|uniref:Uncharacterized protein n=1 Tax=Trichinella zimbabwensis TaxID=268475 RepID=A0A0V1HE99_9BILA|nr:hypothetical protein T11_11547 [Trichinella zimbabwensis]
MVLAFFVNVVNVVTVAAASLKKDHTATWSIVDKLSLDCCSQNDLHHQERPQVLCHNCLTSGSMM